KCRDPPLWTPPVFRPAPRKLSRVGARKGGPSFLETPCAPENDSGRFLRAIQSENPSGGRPLRRRAGARAYARPESSNRTGVDGGAPIAPQGLSAAALLRLVIAAFWRDELRVQLDWSSFLDEAFHVGSQEIGR